MWLSLAAILLLTPAARGQSDSLGVIRGNVVDPSGGSFGTGVVVVLDSALDPVGNVMLSADGTFMLSGIPAREHFLALVQVSPYPDQFWGAFGNTDGPTGDGILMVNAGDTLTVSVTLSEQPIATDSGSTTQDSTTGDAWLGVEILDSSGNPRGAEYVEAHDPASGFKFGGNRITESRFEFSGLPGGDYYVLVHAADLPPQYYAPEANTVEPVHAVPVITGDSIGIQITLTGSPVFKGSITGVVEDSLGTPLSNVTVKIFSPRDTLNAEARTTSDAQGMFEFPDLTERYYYLRFEQGNFYPPQWYSHDGTTAEPVDRIYAGSGTQRYASLSTNPAQVSSLLRLTLIDPEGTPYYGDFTAELQPSEENRGLPFVKSEPEYVESTNVQTAVCRNVRAGKYSLLLHGPFPMQYYHPDGNTTEPGYALQIGEADTQSLEIQFTHEPDFDGTVDGIVRDSVQGAVAGATIELYDGRDTGTPLTSATTTDSGTFTLNVSKTGEYYLKVDAQGFPQQWFSHQGNTTGPTDHVYINGGEFFDIMLSDSPISASSLIRVTVLDSSGSAYTMVESMELHQPMSGFNKIGEPVQANVFAFKGLRDGDYQLLGMAGEFPHQYYAPDKNTSEPSYALKLGENDTIDVSFTFVPDPVFIGLVSGTVADSSGPYAGVTVELFHRHDVQSPARTMVTGDSGTFAFDSLSEHEYYLRCTAEPDYPAQWFSWEGNTETPVTSVWTGGAGGNLYVQLTRKPKTYRSIVTVTVTDETGNPPDSATVKLKHRWDDISIPEDAGATEPHIHVFRGMPPGEYVCELWAEGYPRQYYAPDKNTAFPDYGIRVQDSDTLSITATLITTPVGDTAPVAGGGRISGTVADKRNAAGLSGIEILAIPSRDIHPGMDPGNTGSAYMAMSGSDGTYTIEGLPADNYYVLARPGNDVNLKPQFYAGAGTVDDARTLTVDDKQSVGPIDFTLAPGGVVKGTVVSDNGTAVSYAQVYLRNVASETRVHTVADERGYFVFAGVPGGTYELGAHAGEYFPSEQDVPRQYSVTEQDTTETEPVVLQAGGSFYGSLGYSANLADTIRPPRGFKVLLIPDSLIGRDDRVWSHWDMQAYTHDTSGAYLAGPCPQGKWRAVMMPEPVSRHLGDRVGGKNFYPWFSWTTAEHAATLAASPAVTIEPRDTVGPFDVVFPAGYSLFGTLSDERGEFSTTTSEFGAPSMPFHIDVLARQDGTYFPVSRGDMLPDGRIEIPGLVDGGEYYFEVRVEGYPTQFWSPYGNTVDPKAPYTFSTSKFKPLNIMVVEKPEGYYEQHHGDEPVSIHAEFDSAGVPIIRISVRDLHEAETVELYSKSREGTVEKVFSAPYDSSTSVFSYRETRDLSVTTYRYVALVHGADFTFRSHPLDHDIRDQLPIASDSLRIDVFGQWWGIQIVWGAGPRFEPDGRDSVTLYRREAGAVNWSVLNRRPSWETWLNDHDIDEQSDSGAVFEYKVVLSDPNGTVLRRSPIRRFVLDDTDYGKLHRVERLTVGPDNRDYTTIQAAIDAAEDYDVVAVFPGTYRENLSLKDPATGTARRLRIEGVWFEGRPPVLDAGGGTAVHIPWVADVNGEMHVEIEGLKIRNAADGIRTSASVDVRHCLFVNADTAIRTASDVTAVKQALAEDPFVRNEIQVNAWQCTFIGNGSTGGALVLDEQSDGIDSATVASHLMIAPAVTVASYASTGNSIFAGYVSSPVKLSGPLSHAHLRACNLDGLTKSAIQDGVDPAPDNLFQSSNFLDTTWYFLPDTSPLRSAGDNGETVGYDGRRFHEEGKDGGPSLPPVEDFDVKVYSLDALAVSWRPPPNVEVDHYTLYRVPGDSSLFEVNERSEWEPVDETVESLMVPFRVEGTSFIDTTVEINKPYVYAVAAMGPDGSQGEISMPYPPAFKEYVTEISYRQFTVTHRMKLSGKSWHMVGPWGIDTLDFSVSDARRIYRWDDKLSSDKLLSRYSTERTMETTKGYWIWTEHDTVLKSRTVSFNRLVTEPSVPRVTLVKGASGWNQISSPLPFTVAPSWLKNNPAYEWDPATRGYRETRVLHPWRAAWVHTDRDTTLPLPQRAWDGNAAPLAKQTRSTGWELRVILSGAESSDADNFCGVVAPGLSKSSVPRALEPPRAFDYPQLYFVGNGDPETAASDPNRRLSRSYLRAREVPRSRLEWMIGIAASREDGTIALEGISRVPDEVFLFWATRSGVTNVRESDSIKVDAGESTSYGYLVATANPADIALYANRFAFKGNYPNPFGRATTLEFVVPYAWTGSGMKMKAETRNVALRVYDMRGRLVKTLVKGKVKVGMHRMLWDGTDEHGSALPAGFYAAHLRAKGYAKAVGMIKIR